jgi:hypothetical protein
LLAQHVQGAAPVFGHPDRVSFTLEEMRQELAHAEFVIDY